MCTVLGRGGVEWLIVFLVVCGIFFHFCEFEFVFAVAITQCAPCNETDPSMNPLSHTCCLCVCEYVFLFFVLFLVQIEWRRLTWGGCDTHKRKPGAG